MKIGLVGFPGSGKTTVFNALTGQSAETGYGAARGKTHLGVVKVPDARVDALAKIYQPKKTTYAEIAFSDVAAADWGLVSGFRFLTQKPLLLVLNVDESSVTRPPDAALTEHARAHGLGLVVLSGKVEMDIAQLPPEEQAEFARSLGLDEP